MDMSVIQEEASQGESVMSPPLIKKDQNDISGSNNSGLACPEQVSFQ